MCEADGAVSMAVASSATTFPTYTVKINDVRNLTSWIFCTDTECLRLHRSGYIVNKLDTVGKGWCSL